MTKDPLRLEHIDFGLDVYDLADIYSSMQYHDAASIAENLRTAFTSWQGLPGGGDVMPEARHFEYDSDDIVFEATFKAGDTRMVLRTRPFEVDEFEPMGGVSEDDPSEAALAALWLDQAWDLVGPAVTALAAAVAPPPVVPPESPGVFITDAEAAEIATKDKWSRTGREKLRLGVHSLFRWLEAHPDFEFGLYDMVGPSICVYAADLETFRARARTMGAVEKRSDEYSYSCVVPSDSSASLVELRISKRASCEMVEVGVDEVEVVEVPEEHAARAAELAAELAALAVTRMERRPRFEWKCPPILGDKES